MLPAPAIIEFLEFNTFSPVVQKIHERLSTKTNFICRSCPFLLYSRMLFGEAREFNNATEYKLLEIHDSYTMTEYIEKIVYLTDS